MAGKNKETLESQYRQILSLKGLKFDDCRILSFRFEDETKPKIFHYNLMSPGYDYYFFDVVGPVANVIVSASEPKMWDSIKFAAEWLGGKQITPNLR